MKESGRKFNWKLVVGIIVLVVVLIGIWFVFFSYADCNDWDCFNEKLASCDRAKFIGGTDMIFEYSIRGSFGSACEVEVRFLQGELNVQDLAKIRNKEMMCSLPRGVVMLPESDIGNCHGLLKEGLQDLMIKKLHTYLVQNLGRLNLEMADLPEGI